MYIAHKFSWLALITSIKICNDCPTELEKSDREPFQTYAKSTGPTFTPALSLFSSAGVRVLAVFFWGGAHGEHQERKPKMGCVGRAPSGIKVQSLLSGCQGSRAEAPEAESFLAIAPSTDRANLYHLQYFPRSITIRLKANI